SALWVRDTQKALALIAEVPDALVDAVYESSGQPSSLLVAACYNGNIEVVSELVRRGARVNRPANGMYPLAAAAAGNHSEVVTLLLDHGARINQKNPHGQTALEFALANYHDETTELLRARGGKMYAHSL
ncbi:MAG: ankyrin repeat domain-containing protein, partial [Roseimicrobium sp.]